MNVDFLHSFVTVVEAGSFAEAARRLDLTSAAVAARLHALEDELGVTLIQRAGRSVRPTDAGTKILERARSVLRDVRDLRAIAGNSSLPGELRLGVFPTALVDMLPTLLQRMYAAVPGLSVFVQPGTSVKLCSRVAAGELDAALVIEPQFVLPKTCEWHPLTEERLVVVAHASLRERDPLSLLASEPFIRYDRVSLGGQQADRYLRDNGVRPRQRLEIDSVFAIAALVAKGLGVSLLPDSPTLWSFGLEIARLQLPGDVPVRRVGVVRSLQGPCVPLTAELLRQAQGLAPSPSGRGLG
ncbi:MAG TPA: LysR family transcriptional regulator [Ramlibacter sp.]|uniref:LysR family transcriptional regulator n=1 Tax=Ramlibacter sp. TaxID=1917967 RepID=UPI002ED3F408